VVAAALLGELRGICSLVALALCHLLPPHALRCRRPAGVSVDRLID
jgi:hypothetical protein